ncbi:DUF4129 domain-containing protein [Micromonospora endolithica]|uniref:DUF4129 domain-containing protein n=1 Tax=Micromonospora endolithica TaxID=230091 RepID=A0A3A9YPZ9_9ACTN|nr:DUF4129 domain-containing protein [Micromonospora endolithica]RKN38083.1 DUF4129 domain-containing protein [Micromonospora endolithica]TWJ23859.1 uncharacterized protein DUF4129 [Micromonospora endolithica]
MSFSRWWTETTASLGDRLPLPLATLLLVLGAVLVAAGWYTFPAWVPRRLPRLRLPRLRRPRLRRPRRSRRPARTGDAAVVPSPREPEAEPAMTADVSLADRLAGQGRYAEAVRERLRAMVRELVARRVVTHEPGMTVVELVAAAARSRPPVEPPLGAAGAIFSELWYAHRTATAEHDRRMREHAEDLRRLLDGEGP